MYEHIFNVRPVVLVCVCVIVKKEFSGEAVMVYRKCHKAP